MLIDVLRSVLGEEPSDRALWTATRGKGASARLAQRVLDAYKSDSVDPVPAKDRDHFRPAFLSDYSGRSSTPYDREFVFVERALCYADSVAVEDDLARWESLAATDEGTLAFEWSSGFADCDNSTWTLRRIAKYGWLEEAGLLYYVDPPTRKDVADIRSGVEEDAIEELAELVMERKQYTREISVHPSVLAGDLTMWLREFYALLEHCNNLENNIDLYLPSWFAGPELLNWWLMRSLAWTEQTTALVMDHSSLTDLIVLPAVPDMSIHDLDRSTVLRMRDGLGLNRWREDFREALAELHNGEDVTARASFRRKLHEAKGRLERDVASDKRLGPRLSGTVTAGLASGSVAAVTGQDVLATTLIGAAPAGVAVMQELYRWLTAVSHSNVTEPVYRLFMDGNQRHSSGAVDMRSAPSIMGLDSRGRPFHHDLFEGL